ncbi:MAG: arylsulfatase [Bacteroidales bacterium]|nr:arylsulfatase [Bacteroidales bacterium]
MHEEKIKIGYHTAGAALAMGAVAFGGCTQEKKTESKPNVVFILMDDSGYCDWGCYGQTKTETPSIDALAANGIRFTDFYAGAPQSSPSRCGLLTGLHNGHTQIRANDEQYWRGDVFSLKAMMEHPELEGQAPLANSTITLGTMMQKAGYTTGMIGKWGLGGPTSGSTPNKMGFDFYYGYLCQRSAQCYYPQYLYRNGEREFLGNPFMELGEKLPEDLDEYDIVNYEPYKGTVYSPDAMYTEVENFISENKDHPFFLMWTTTIPHSAMQAPDEYVGHYVEKFGDEEPVARANGYFPCRYPRATYAAMISYLDMQIGKMVQHLKDEGVYDNTIIIVTSDNGPAQSKCNSSAWFDNSHPFHSEDGYTKRTLQEGGIRMPFILTWGDRIKPSVSHQIAWFPDMMATFCDMAGIEQPYTTDGVSLWPTITGKPRKQETHDFLYWEFPAFKKARGYLAVRMGEYKGLVKNVADGGNKMELYRINEDPLEEHDLSEEYPEIVGRMWEIIRAEHTSHPNPIMNTEINWPAE